MGPNSPESVRGWSESAQVLRDFGILFANVEGEAGLAAGSEAVFISKS